jgi:UDP-N-acetylmuramoyl-L-alanyl-D-glutamate--2,6-diaminopimelate ligase
VGVRAVRVAGNPEIVRVCEDSRQVRAGDLFVARSGTKANGAQFAAEAVAKGAVAVVGDAALELLETVAFAQVGNVNLALALLAHELAGNPTRGMKMIGVTGTKGKTTVAYLMRSVLKAAGFKVGMIGTVEIDDGEKVVPAEMTTPGVVELAALFGRMRANGVTHCVMEVSSHALHQQRVAGIDFDVAIFTNLTGDHLDYHKTMEEYAAAKAILFEGLKEGAVAVVNGDDKWAEQVVRGCKGRVVHYGVEGRSAWRARIQGMTISGTEVDLSSVCGESQKLYSPLVGKHNVYNSLGVVIAARALGIPMSVVVDGLDQMEGVPGRLERVAIGGVDPTGNLFQVFVDYAHTHDALENVLTALRATMGPSKSSNGVANGMLSDRSERFVGSRGHGSAAEHGTRPPYGGTTNASTTNGRLICVFGCGGDRDRTKRLKMGAVAERLEDVVIVTSDNPRTEEPGAIIEEICAGFSAGWKDAGKITVEPDRRAAIRIAIDRADAGDVVLIAGKGHENYQIIGTTKHHFDDVEEAMTALQALTAKRTVN